MSLKVPQNPRELITDLVIKEPPAEEEEEGNAFKSKERNEEVHCLNNGYSIKQAQTANL